MSDMVRVGIGMAAGAAWGLANFWCLAHLLRTMVDPAASRSRAMSWMLVKFPACYAAAVALLLMPAVSAIGFGFGFVCAIVLVIGASLLIVQRPPASVHVG